MTRLLFPTFLMLFLLWPAAFSQPTISSNDTLQLNALLKDKQFDLAVPLLEKMLDASLSEKNWASFQVYLKKIAEILTEQEKYEYLQTVLQRQITNLEAAGQGNSITAANIWSWLAKNNLKLADYVAVLDNYACAIKIYEKNAVLGDGLAFCYKNAAQICIRRGNSELASRYLNAALLVDTSGRYNCSIYGQLANNAYWQDSIDIAYTYFLQGKTIANPDKKHEAALNEAGALILTKKGGLPEAMKLALQAFQYYKSDRTNGDQQIRCLSTLADIANHQGEFNKAEQYFRQAETAVQRLFKGKSREMAKLYTETGLFYEQHNQPDRALSYFQKALVQAFPNFNSLEITDNPNLSEALLESQAMRATAAKAQLLLKLSNTSKNAAALRLNAAHCLNLSFAVAARLRHTYGNDVDKIALSANNRIAYQAAALNLWQLWNDTRETTYLDQLFSLIEQTKAQSLADALQQQKALVLSAIPDSLLQREALLRLESADATNESEKLEAGKDSTEASKKLRAFRQKMAYDDFIEQLGKQYPQFRQYAEADVTSDVSAIRKALPDSTVLLSWFDAGDRYLCLRLHDSEIRASEVKRDSVFDRSLLDFIALLSDLNRQQASPGDFFQAAHALHQKLFPIDPLAGVKSLLIVPDGLLCYLPFEVLLTAPHDKGGFATAPYMFRQCAVTYSWSAKLLAVSMTPAAQLGFVQFAPFASSARDHLAVLDNSLADVPQTMSSSVLEGTEASTATFRAEAPENNVIHLSTHAQVGKDGVPGIEFFDRTMTLPEIYAQRFQASLVTLSACETGAGKFAGGEGVLSLARAFAYAGAQSMVASLWSVNDRATAALFSAFYQNLQQGNSKSEALRQAKLACLSAEESDARKAPYYWAAFTLSGADGSVNMSNPWSVLWQWGLAILVLSMAIFWGFRKRRKSQTSA